MQRKSLVHHDFFNCHVFHKSDEGIFVLEDLYYSMSVTQEFQCSKSWLIRNVSECKLINKAYSSITFSHTLIMGYVNKPTRENFPHVSKWIDKGVGETCYNINIF